MTHPRAPLLSGGDTILLSHAADVGVAMVPARHPKRTVMLAGIAALATPKFRFTQKGIEAIMGNSLIEKTAALRSMPVTRRTAVRRLGVAGFAAALALGGGRYAIAHEGHSHDGTPEVTDGTPTLAAEYPEVVIVAKDFSFELPSSFEGGFVKLTVDNQGQHDHHAMFVKLNAGVSWEDFEETLQSPDFGAVLGAGVIVGGPPSIHRGTTASVVAELPAGQYAVICVIPDEDGIPHYIQGMYAPVEVTEPTSALSSPIADVTVDMDDFAFHVMPLNGPFVAGPQIWSFPNVGQQVHEAVIYRISDGMTFENVAEIFGIASPSTPESASEPDSLATASLDAIPDGPPFVAIGGVAPMNPGFTNWALLDLDPGEYFIICFIPDPATGAPHFALGMIMPFTVD